MKVLDAYPEIAERFAGVQEEGNGAYVNADCPLRCHSHARVRFWLGDDQRLVFCCWAGCNKLEILRSVGLSFKDCFRDRIVPDAVKREMTARYPYRDESGQTLYEVVRFEPGFNGREKDLRPRWANDGGWCWGLPKEIRRVLYRLPELLAADAGRTVLVVAGEKDSDNLHRLGIVATTNVFGERSEWLAEYSLALAGRDVVVIPDADSAGSRHADEVVGSLVRHGVGSVRVAPLPAKDCTAFINGLRVQGVTESDELRRRLWAAIQESELWKPSRNRVVSADTAASAV